MRLRTLALALTLVAVAAPAAASGAPLRATARGAVAVQGSLEAPILEELNAVRRAHGLGPLRMSTGLERAAAVHARSMALHGYFSHDSMDGTSAASRIRHYYDSPRSPSRLVGEALLWRAPDVTADAAVRMWLASPPHRRLLLLAAFSDVGLAAVHVTHAGGVYGGLDATIVVADFGVR